MVFLNRYFSCLIITLIANTGVFADDTQPIKTDINEKVETLDTEILDLEISYEMGMDAYDINMEAEDISNQLLYHEYQLGTPKGDDEQWNESEQMILEAKIKLQALQEKIKVEGDWGQLRFRVQDFRGSDPGAIKLRYNYGF